MAMRDIPLKSFLFYFGLFLYVRVSYVQLDIRSILNTDENVPSIINGSGLSNRDKNTSASIPVTVAKEAKPTYPPEPRTVQDSFKIRTNSSSSAAEGAFLRGELLELVNKWEASSISTEEARHALWRIVSQPSYINHRPLYGIVFIKTHKTGSSTITSVLHSLATAHNLLTPITMDTAPYIPQDEKHNHILNLKTTKPNVTSAPYDVWCNHVVYDNLLTDKVVPSSQHFVVTIVRDAATRLRSACQHYGCCPSEYSNDEMFNNFVLSNRAKRLFTNNKQHCRVDQSSYQIVGTGLHANKSFAENFEAVLNEARHNKFLLLVTERMVESMLVLWYFYKLHPLDVAFLSKKVAKTSLVSPQQASNKTIAAEHLIREWNPYDTRIHAVANELLTRHLELIFPHPTMRQRAQEQLQSLNDLLFHVCHPKQELGSSTELHDWCEEKALDNWEWNRKHLQVIRKQQKTPAPGYPSRNRTKDASFHRSTRRTRNQAS